MKAHPNLYQVDTRLALGRLGTTATFDDFPDGELDRLAQAGFDAVWFLGVWQTGAAGQRISRARAEWRREFRELLPDLRDEDICGSCFAVQAYTAHEDFGGDAALARLRDRVRARGMRLLLDFVPNHTAQDHAWVQEHPEYYVPGPGAPDPRLHVRLGERVLALGRDPHYDGWPDTLQLDYANPAVHEAMRGELARIAELCDGVRCDMAMLALPEVFERTWGRRPPDFWPAAIEGTRREHPGFLFLAEVYWDLEWTLQQQGFDFTYDKRLYDRLRQGQARPVREHLSAALEFQGRSVRFLENHDEARAASAFPPGTHQAAAVLTYLGPGLRLFHEGQLEGWTRKVPVHLRRGPAEPTDEALRDFYGRLLALLRRPEPHGPEWRMLESLPAWGGNGSWGDFVAFAWGERLLVVVNFSPHRSQCYLDLPFDWLAGRGLQLRDLLGTEVYHRWGNDLIERGLYLDLPAWGHHVFEITGP